MSVDSEWTEFLRATGGQFDGPILRGFGNPDRELQAARDGGVVCDLSHLGTISAGGEEAREFLQGQLTCDLHELNSTRSLLGAWLTPKGRVQTLFRLLQWEDSILLELPRDRLESSLNRLRIYLLRARARLEDVSADFIRLGINGESAEPLIQEWFGALPQSEDAAVIQPGAAAVRLPGEDAARFGVIFDQVASARAFWEQASRRLTPAGYDAWRLLNVLAGIPEAVEADEYLPQMLNLDQLGGLSFTKGCYVGQEIVARTQHLGRLKRRMFLLHLETDEAPESGASLFTDDGANHADGRLLQSSRDPRGGCAALGVISIEAAQRTLRLGNGVVARIRALPYAQQASVSES